eukprot:353375-Chlamydomonas_euryale.AAC.6
MCENGGKWHASPSLRLPPPPSAPPLWLQPRQLSWHNAPVKLLEAEATGVLIVYFVDGGLEHLPCFVCGQSRMPTTLTCAVLVPWSDSSDATRMRGANTLGATHLHSWGPCRRDA